MLTLAQLTQRAATLLRVGATSATVWQQLALEDPERAAVLPKGGGSGQASGASGSTPATRALAAAWAVALQSGAPLAAALERCGESLRAVAGVAARRQVLLAGPQATIRLVAWLPLVAVLLAVLLGFDPFVVLGSPVGWVCAAVGALLLWFGVRWAQRLTAAVTAADWVPGWAAELTSLALAGGIGVDAAVRLVADCAAAERAEWVRFDDLRDGGVVRRVIHEADRLGSGSAAMLVAAATDSRALALQQMETATERLGVRLLLPVGVCVLPSFVFLGVIPVLLSVVGASAE